MIKTKHLHAFEHSDVVNSVLDYNNNITNKKEIVHNIDTNQESSQETKSLAAPSLTLDPDLLRRKKKRCKISNSYTAVASTINIEKVTTKQLRKKYAAKNSNSKDISIPAAVCVMSPPCQPHTQNNYVSGANTDPRSASILHLCTTLLPGLDFLERPILILLENVVGLETVEFFLIKN